MGITQKNGQSHTAVECLATPAAWFLGTACWSVHHNISTTPGWIAVKFSTEMLYAQMMKSDDFGNSSTFPVVPPTGQSFTLSIGTTF